MQLSDQALGAVMMALQKSDIVPVLKGFVFIEQEAGLVVENPPLVEFNTPTEASEEEDAEV